MAAITSEILLDAVSLLIQCRDEQSLDLINELIELYSDESKNQASMDNGLSQKFVTLLDQLKHLPNDATGDREKNTLIVKFLTDPVVKQDDLFYKAMKDIFDSAESGDGENVVSSIKKKLINSILWNKFNKCTKRIWGKLNSCNMATDLDMQEMYLNDAINAAREIVTMTQGVDRLKKGAVERIEMSNKESIRKSLELYNAREVKGTLKTGLVGLNRMLGKRDGFALGESVCIYALLHNFKSGLLMTIARGLVCYNDPPEHFTGKPAVVFVSLENEANKNLMWFYRVAYETSYEKSSEGLSDDAVIEFVHHYYTSKGWEFFIERWPGNKFGYDEFVSLIESYEAQGYQIAAILVDYANKMKKGSGNTKENTKQDHLAITELFENMCTYTKTKGILFITAHQLNREAMKAALNATGVNHVKNFSAAFAAGSIGASQEIDLEIFIHLEMNHLGQKFLTMQRGKHRYVDNTPETHKYCAYQFSEWGIGDDILKDEANYVSDIYAVEEADDTSSAGIAASLSALF